MKFEFQIKFIQPPRHTEDGHRIVRTETVIPDIVALDPAELTVEEVGEQVIRTEQFLEKLLGCRVHIEQVG
ncbi:MAG: hypothetical protein ABFD60_01490 [Bryobacteraceae bacterium]